MRARVRSTAIGGVLAASLAWLGHYPDADALGADGAAWVEALVDEAERGELDPDLDPCGLLRRLATSPRRALRARVAEAAGALATLAPDAAQGLLRQLAHDPAGGVRRAAARGLARFMEHADTCRRAAVGSGWAHAAAEDERVAFALALGQATPDFMTDLALEELAGDSRPRVRRAALASARALLPLHPEPYLRLAMARLADPDRRTRKLARATLRAASGRPEVAALAPSAALKRESRRRLRRALRAEPDRRSTPLELARA